MLTSEISYPIIAMYDDGTVEFSASDEQFSRATTLGLKRGAFQNLTVIDSHGSQYRTTSVKVIGGIGPLWGYLPFGGRLLRVEVTIEKCCSYMRVKKLKTQILKMLRSEGGWSSIVGVELSDIIDEIQSVNTIEGIMLVLCKYS